MTVQYRSGVQSSWLGGSLQICPPEVCGNAYFVNSNSGSDTANSGESWTNALATIDAAVNKCTASQADVIYVHPAHAENLAADSAVDVDLAGVHIAGIRMGRMMPTLTATAVAGDLKLAAANCSLSNIRFLNGIDACTGIIEVSGADCAVINCEARDSVGQSTDSLHSVDGADRLLIDGHRHIGAAGDGGDTAIFIDGSDDCIIRNFQLYGNFDLGAIEFRTTLSARVRVYSGDIWTAGAEDLAIKDVITGTTGSIGPDITIMLTDNAANITEAITAATCQIFDPIYVCNLAGEKAMLTNITASTDGA